MHTSPHGAASLVLMRAWGVRVHTLTRPPPWDDQSHHYPIVNGVRFIPVNPSPILKVALPLGSALPFIPTFMIVHL